MPFVIRNSNGVITGLVADAKGPTAEFLPASHLEVIRYIEGSGAKQDIQLALSETDGAFARATEDLIHLLVKKNIILFTELPDAVQSKLLAREKLREHLGNLGNRSPISEDDTI